MPDEHKCHNCGRPVNGSSAIETVDYDLWGEPMQVWVCRDRYGARKSIADPTQATLGFPDQPHADDAA